MSLKAKLVSTIAAFCMVICLLSVGIWAASTGTVNVGGTVSFTATDVDVTIYGVVGTAAADAEDITTEIVTWDAASTGDTLTEDWTNALNFTKGQDIVISLKVVNNNEERAVTVTLVDDETAATNYTHTPSAGSSIAAGQSAVYTITLKVTDWNKKVEGTLSYDLTVTNG
ncbi:MAG: hypothetical protein J6C53_02615 [Clostridia bacterium]|nr:hypothetical protein [Clostridia bacterium]